MRTRLASGLTAASFVFLIAALVLRSWQVVLLALPPAMFLAVGALFPPPVPALVAVRSVSRERVHVGMPVEVELAIHNDGPSLGLVEVVDQVPRGLAVVRGTDHIIASLPSGGDLRLRYVVRPTIKGDFEIGPVRARALDPLGFGAEDAVLPVASRVVAAPQMEDLRRTRLAPRRTRPWYGQVTSRRLGIGTDFWGVRDYVPGDEVRRVNWKASARLDRLFSNEYEGERSGDVVIVLDARREAFVGTETDNPIEHGVRAALGIAENVLASRNRVGLIVQRDVLDRVSLAFGRKQLYRILDHLVHVRPGGDWPFAHIGWVVQRFFPRDSLIVLISPLSDRTALDAVLDLAASGYEIVIVSPSPLAIQRRLGTEGTGQDAAFRILRMERENLLTELRRVAQVIDWHPATPLALPLRRMERWLPPA